MDVKPLKIYIGEILPGFSLLPFLRLNFNPGKVVLNSFSEPDAFSFVEKPFFEIVSEPALADFFLIPYNFFHIKDRHEIINYFDSLARSYEKKILIFALGDSSEFVSVSNSIVFRTSQYRSVIKTNEVIIPAFVPDMLRGKSLVTLTKKEKATVGFCGWAEFKTKGQRAKFFIKNMFLKFGPRRQGIYFRSKAISSLNSSNLVNTNFLIRSNHFGNRKTIIGDPLLVRREYVDNILNSDFVLSPKGDGNYSVRFYETLSLGRIPLLIDTDTPLPFEADLCYEEFILRISYKKINEIGKIVSDFYSGLTNEQYILMQKKAREAYEKCLCPEIFFRQVFSFGFLARYK
jgi:hypothetical protein